MLSVGCISYTADAAIAAPPKQLRGAKQLRAESSHSLPEEFTAKKKSRVKAQVEIIARLSGNGLKDKFLRMMEKGGMTDE